MPGPGERHRVPGGGGGAVAARPRFDPSISLMEHYQASEIRRLLEWANYNMIDALKVRGGFGEFSSVHTSMYFFFLLAFFLAGGLAASLMLMRFDSRGGFSC